MLLKFDFYQNSCSNRSCEAAGGEEGRTGRGLGSNICVFVLEHLVNGGLIVLLVSATEALGRAEFK